MHIIDKLSQRAVFRGVTSLAGALAILLLIGCANNYGRFTLDDQVDRDFRQGVVQPQYNYYYAGRDTIPYAIIGIDKAYTISSKQWDLFSPEPQQLKKMVGSAFGEVYTTPMGAYILDAQGTKIGIWYSNIYNRSVSVDPVNRTVTLLFINPENTRSR